MMFANHSHGAIDAAFTFSIWKFLIKAPPVKNAFKCCSVATTGDSLNNINSGGEEAVVVVFLPQPRCTGPGQRWSKKQLLVVSPSQPATQMQNNPRNSPILSTFLYFFLFLYSPSLLPLSLSLSPYTSSFISQRSLWLSLSFSLSLSLSLSLSFSLSLSLWFWYVVLQIPSLMTFFVFEVDSLQHPVSPTRDCLSKQTQFGFY